MLKDVRPDLKSEWRPTKNVGIAFEELSYGSGRRVWWQCDKHHEWRTSPNERNRGRGCPYCARKLLSLDTSLEAMRPDIAAEWHPTKNLGLKPYEVLSGISKKVWWICHKGHEWQDSINHRTSGRCCPYCAGKRPSIDNCLQTLNPRLAKEWHPTKNGNLTPNDVTAMSGRRVWWLCKKGHEWRAPVNNRQQGKGCRICSGRIASDQHSLFYNHPRIAREWHPIKNGSLTPDKVTPSSNKKVWWICKRGHEWQAVVASRTAGTSCPYCNSKSSQAELRAYTEIKGLFSDAKHRYKVAGYECDVFVPSLSFGFDYDGSYWHKDKLTIDKAKYQAINNKRIVFIKVREEGLQKVADNDIVLNKDNTQFEIIERILQRILALPSVSAIDKAKVEKYLLKRAFINNDEYEQIQYALPSPPKEYSLALINPVLAKDWHPFKNITLTTYDVSTGSDRKVWWKCRFGHEWQDTVSHRNSGRGCPYCSHKRVSKENCFALRKPILAKEWHPSRNDALTASDVSVTSNKKVWWKCKKGHEWEASVNNRTNGRGCPYCGGRRIDKTNCLQVLNPLLAAEWHSEKNMPLTPMDVGLGHRRVWWQCKEGHEWQAEIGRRHAGSGCPYCSGLYVTEAKSLKSKFPSVASEWHLTKNLDLTPDKVMPKSGKVVWWICSKGHEYIARIADRSNGMPCPFCIGRRICDDNCLRTLNPSLAKEWHPTKNKGLSPDDVGPNSGQKVWWLCERKHVWQASIGQRNRGQACPYCINRRVSKDNCLQTTHPGLAREWHKQKNGSLTTRDVTYGSGIRVWWKCSKGHEWQTSILNRSRGTGCPYCWDRNRKGIRSSA